MNIITHERQPVAGIDVAKYQGRVKVPRARPPWLRYFAFKATDTKKVPEMGVDPQLVTNRTAGIDMNVRWRPIYMYLRDPALWGSMAEQFALYTQAVGKLETGECVMVDWEAHELTLEDIRELEHMIEVVYGRRWVMYVNDQNSDMTRWLDENVAAGSPVPVIHPNYSEYGLSEAKRWDAAVWQVGIAERSTCPEPFELYPEASGIDVDWVLKPHVMDHVCGRSIFGGYENQ